MICGPEIRQSARTGGPGVGMRSFRAAHFTPPRGHDADRLINAMLAVRTVMLYKQWKRITRNGEVFHALDG